MNRDSWKVQIKGDKCGRSFEICVVRESNEHGLHSWGWFDENKLLISHSGTHQVTLTEKVWNEMVALAKDIAIELNAEEST